MCSCRAASDGCAIGLIFLLTAIRCSWFRRRRRSADRRCLPVYLLALRPEEGDEADSGSRLRLHAIEGALVEERDVRPATPVLARIAGRDDLPAGCVAAC